MSALQKTLESQVRVQYQDCDPFNHLNNSRYIDYIMGARTEQLLDQYGFHASELARNEAIGWVAAQTQISYFHPATWMETVTIQSRLIRFSERSLLIEALMWDQNKKSMKAVMWAKLVHFDILTQKSRQHTEELMKLFTEMLYSTENSANFEDRVKSLREQVSAS
jgi:acyl-CoA thioester hydrolase